MHIKTPQCSSRMILIEPWGAVIPPWLMGIFCGDRSCAVTTAPTVIQGLGIYADTTHERKTATPQASSTRYLLRVVTTVTSVTTVPNSSRSDSAC